MSKKTFAQAPKPRQLSDEQIRAFEMGGVGHDTSRTHVVPSAAAIQEESVKRLSIDLPASLHTRFKTACSANSVKMAGELQSLIELRTAELETAAGMTRK